MRRTAGHRMWIASALTLAGFAHAQTLDGVVVTGSRAERASFDLPFAVTTVDADTIRSAGPMVNVSEVLQRVPGIMANNRSNYAQDLQLSSRGFGARSSFGVRGIRVYTDGIPASMPDGQGQVSHLDLASAARIEVLRGPFSALYGNSSGGVIALVSQTPTRPALSVETGIGRFQTKTDRLRGDTTFADSAGWAGRFDANYFETGGFRPHSVAHRALSDAQLSYVSDRDRLIVDGNAFAQPADDPLGLTRAQFNADPRQTASQATTFNTRKNTRQEQGGASWRHALADGVVREFAVSTYVGQRGVAQWQAIAPAAQTSPSSPGGVIAFERDYAGADARATLRFGPVDVIVGVNPEQSRENRRGYENFVGTGARQVLGVTGRLRRDETNTVRSVDEYAQGEWNFAPRWTATAGIRHIHVRIDSRDHYLSNGDDSGQRAFDSTNPVAGLAYALTDNVNVYASAGRGYETPTLNELAYRPDGSAGLNLGIQPQRSRQLEVGAKTKIGAARADLALFDAEVDEEIVVVANTAGRASYGNAGRTRRRGAEFSLAWPFASAWRVNAALTWLDATYRDPFKTCLATPCPTPNVPVGAGTRLPGTARLAAFGELVWTPWTDATVGAEWRGVSKVNVNDADTDAAAGYGVAALRAEQRITLGAWKLSASARVDNLFDRTYAGSVIVNETNGRYFEPASPRAWFVGVGAHVDL